MSGFSEIDKLPNDLVENAIESSIDNMKHNLFLEYFLYLDQISGNSFFENTDDFKSYLLEKSGKFTGTKQDLVNSNGGTTGGIISFIRDVSLESKSHRRYKVKVEFCFTETPLDEKNKKVYLGEIIEI